MEVGLALPPPNSCSPAIRLPAICSPNACSPAIRPGWRVLRQQLTLLGSPSVLRLCAHAQSPHHLIPCSPAIRLPAICSPNACSPAIRPGWRVLRQQLTLLGSPSVLRHHAYAQSPHHVYPLFFVGKIPTSPHDEYSSTIFWMCRILIPSLVLIAFSVLFP